ncbi:hypothetical protein Dsin_030737 [Dipteronia sinensis]|uniref:Myb-like domain-containing protein n=1 Tax=Dipteronia sinensis TaxID=43782 RepID=A0AAE0DRD1_9ROSI|nr:hypothetical protein Dsin_030737 [Dipteronia sinensis]
MGKGQQGEWGEEEGRDLIQIRRELETGIKRNKNLWEIVSLRLTEKGHTRTPDQCKRKWKNLLNRYKGKEMSDPESGKQCHFFDELQEVFSEREKTMQTQSQSRLSDDDDDDDDDDESGVNRSNCRKRKAESRDVPELLEEQLRMEMDWIKMMERHASERRLFEQEWRVSMEKRERERLIAHRTWMDTEEQRILREESRAQTRHALFTTLLAQLLDDDK